MVLTAGSANIEYHPGFLFDFVYIYIYIEKQTNKKTTSGHKVTRDNHCGEDILVHVLSHLGQNIPQKHPHHSGDQ